MNHPTHFTVPEVFTIEHAGKRITGQVLERSVRRLTVQLVEPHGLLHVTKQVHPSIGGALGFEGTAGDSFKVELLQFLYDRAVLLDTHVQQLVHAYRTLGQAEACVQRLRPVIGSYAPFNAHSFMLATTALEHRPMALPPLGGGIVPQHMLSWCDLQVLVYGRLQAGPSLTGPFGRNTQSSTN